jgi:hypothetical protein
MISRIILTLLILRLLHSGLRRMTKFMQQRCLTLMTYIDDAHDVDTYDQYVGAQVNGPVGVKIHTGRVVWRTHELDGTVRG